MEEKGGPQSFLRESVKYWVPVRFLTSVKEEIMQHLPQYWYKNIRDPFIASIYLDNAAHSMYRSRMQLKEGSQIIRIRVYGSKKSHKIVFVERKTHLKGWRGLHSLKERFTLENNKLRDLTRGILPIDSSSPNGNLIDEIQDAIGQLQLKPSIRTTYCRSAYQNGEDLSLRISLDEDLTFIKDESNLLNPLSIDWSSAYASTLPPSHVHRFQYAILEVKIQKSGNNPGDGMPSWISALEGKGYIIEVAKFSKFLTATALLKFDQVTEIPSWFPEMDLGSRSDFKSKEDIEAGIQVQVDSRASNANVSQPLSNEENALMDKKLVHRNMRVGPKLFLSNERTFLNWAQQILAIATFGGILVQQDDYDTPVLLSGMVVVVFGIAILMRVLYKYRLRVKIVKELGEAAQAFPETIAPIGFSILVLAIMVGVIIAGAAGQL